MKRQSTSNGFGHFRKQPSIEQFEACFERRNGTVVLGEFLNSTATWVASHFASIELEVYQAATLGRVAREQGQQPDHQTVKAQCPRLAILATDKDLREILDGNPSAKKSTAAMLARILHRAEGSILRWGKARSELIRTDAQVPRLLFYPIASRKSEKPCASVVSVKRK